MKKIFVLLTASILISKLSLTASAADVKKVKVMDITNTKQTAQLTADYWKDSFFGEVTISPDEGTAKRDGEKIALKEILPITDSQSKKAMQSVQSAEKIIKNNTSLEVFTDDKGVLHITDPFQSARLIVYTEKLKGSFGAEKILRDAKHGVYYLQFSDKDKAKNACIKLRKTLGNENCHPDKVYTAASLSIDDEENICVNDNNSAQTLERPSCVSWGNTYMGLDSLKNQVSTEKRKTVKTAVIDTGLNRHEIFYGHKITGHSFVGRHIYSAKFSPKIYRDYYGHGTHVAGIIADGTDSNVQIMALRVFDEDDYTTDLTVESAIQYAVDKGADIVNMSFNANSGYKQDNFHQWDKVLKRLYKKGAAAVVSAGNTGREKVEYPANLSTTIAVGALDERGQTAYFSSFGDEIDFTAPGDEVMSSSSIESTGYKYMSGTSQSAAHITAALSMLKALHSEYNQNQLVQELAKYCTDLGEEGKDKMYGNGVPNLRDLYTD